MVALPDRTVRSIPISCCAVLPPTTCVRRRIRCYKCSRVFVAACSLSEGTVPGKHREGRAGTKLKLPETCGRTKNSCVVAMVLSIALAFQGVEPGLAFTLFGNSSPEKDPVGPFTLYGSIVKKYLIEEIVDGKIVGRKKGFTATACVSAMDASKETPEVVGLPAGLKVTLSGEASCFKGVAQNRDDSCRPPCKAACLDAVKHHSEEVKQSTGYTFDSMDAAKAVDACASQCFNECSKPGTSIAFVQPIRPRR